jgi:hypothetical protein
MSSNEGPHIFDNEAARLADSDWGLLEIEQGDGPDASEHHLVAGVVLVPRSRQALVVKTGFEGDEAWASLHKVDTATGRPVVSRVVLDDDGTEDEAQEILADRTDVR